LRSPSGSSTFVALFLDMLIDGWARLRPEFFTQFPSRRAGQAGSSRRGSARRW